MQSQNYDNHFLFTWKTTASFFYKCTKPLTFNKIFSLNYNQQPELRINNKTCIYKISTLIVSCIAYNDFSNEVDISEFGLTKKEIFYIRRTCECYQA